MRDDELELINLGRNAIAAASNENGNSRHPATSLGLAPASTIRPRNPIFLEGDGRIPVGAVTIVAGVGGLGKSTYTVQLAARTSQSGKVLMISTEDDWETTIVPRLIAAGANMNNVFLPKDPEGRPTALRFPNDLKQLAELARQLSGLRLIILDPISAMVDVDRINNNDDANVRTFLDPLGSIAREHNCAVVAVAHFNKRENASVFLRLAASGGYYNSVRSVVVWTLSPHSPHERYLAHAKCNVGELQPTEHYRIEIVEIGNGLSNTRATRIGTVRITAEQLVNPPRAGGRGERIVEAEQLITTLWKEQKGPVAAATAKAAGAEQGISESTMERALHNLGGTSARRGFGAKGGWFWVPPDGFFPMTQQEVTSMEETDPETSETPAGLPKTSADDVYEDQFPLNDEKAFSSRRLSDEPRAASQRRHDPDVDDGPPRCSPDCICPIMPNHLHLCQQPVPF